VKAVLALLLLGGLYAVADVVDRADPSLARATESRP